MFSMCRFLYPRYSYHQMTVRFFDKLAFPKYKGENVVTELEDEHDFPKLKDKKSFSGFKYENTPHIIKNKSMFSRFKNNSPKFREENSNSKFFEDSNGIIKYRDEQVAYIKLATENIPDDWNLIKKNILSKSGNLNEKNIDAVMLKHMIGLKHFDSALSFGKHLISTNDELSLGSINGLLFLYSTLKSKNLLTDDHKQFILNSYKHLYKKHKVLDYTTGEKLLHALCSIEEWEKAIKVLADIHLSGVPTHSAYSVLIGTLFKLNKKKKAFEMIEESLSHKRPLQKYAFSEWLDYILRKYTDKKVIAKHLEEICLHISKYCVVVDDKTANKIKAVYSSLDWTAEFTRIRKYDGQCTSCKQTLDCLKLSSEEFSILQQNIKEKLIVGSDLFLKTSPDELKRFLEFVEKTAPYDIVIDALNVSYAVGKGNSMDRLNLLRYVVDNFVDKQKKILVLGRKHMLKWQRGSLAKIMSNVSTFFTENISQDDPYFITAAILSGSHTDIVSKDLLRGHTFLLKDEYLRNIFKRWQWQHQWMIFLNGPNGVTIQPPLSFTPCAQKKSNGWHLPYEKETELPASHFNDGTPDLSSWLCLRPKV